MPANLPARERNTTGSTSTLRRGLLPAALVVCAAIHFLTIKDGAIWLPALGASLAAAVWVGPRFLVSFAAVLIGGSLVGALAGWPPILASRVVDVIAGGVVAGEVALAWFVFCRIARGRREFDDPRTAVLFLLLVLGLTASTGAIVWVGLREAVGANPPDAAFFRLFGESWIAAMLGFGVVTPFLLVNGTVRLQMLGYVPELKGRAAFRRSFSYGDAIELAGLSLGNFLLSLIQVHLHLRIANAAWPLWSISLLLVVWSSIRQGIRGGTTTTFAGCAAALVWAGDMGVSPADLSPLQGNFLAQCAIAALVGASVAWIRVTEARYRHVVGHIPLVLTSVRLNRGIAFLPDGVPLRTTTESRPELKGGDALVREAEIVLVSRACQSIVGLDPDQLVGPFSLWLDVVHPDDREIVVAAISQLGLERQTVTCEYRVIVQTPSGTKEPVTGEPAPSEPAPSEAAPSEPATGERKRPEATAAVPTTRWVRDTFAPHYTGDGLLDGWDGVVEEINDQRTLQQENRRIAGMLQALVANLPTGVFFVQGPNGQPILVNARARQLLGQREDLAAGIVHLSQVYRLHRQDGSEYPVDELPVAKALRYGQTCTSNDIIVHRPDGRRIPLFTWAAPIDLGTVGRPEAAVWVLEDLSALQQAEFARRESEARLRAVFETLAEGVVVQNKAGVIIEGNPSAAHILGLTIDQLIGRSWLGPDVGCLRDDGSPCPADQQPDRLAMRIKLPVRNLIIGLPRASGEVRWVLVNSMPLPVGTAFSPNTQGAQLVTTFADISAERLAQRVVMSAKEKYQTLVETLPVMVVQLDPAGSVLFMNPAAHEFVGGAAGDFATPGLFEATFDPADRPRVSIALQETMYGKDSRFEFGLQSRDGETKIGLAIVQPMRHEGAIVGSTWIVVDMTRQRRLEEELVKSQRLELIGRLASGAVHDFNNLMMSVIGTAGILKVEVRDQPNVVENLDLIERTASEASRILAQILDLGKSPSRPSQSLCVNRVVDATLDLLRNVVPANIRVQTLYARDAVEVLADEVQLKQVILNLCLNARDAMPSGGLLRVVTRIEQRGPRQWAIVAIEDTGHGIPRDLQDRIYEPFFTTKERGAGIGLSVVRDIVQRFGGVIDVWSDPRTGTRFEVRLPLAPAAAKA